MRKAFAKHGAIKEFYTLYSEQLGLSYEDVCAILDDYYREVLADLWRCYNYARTKTQPHGMNVFFGEVGKFVLSLEKCNQIYNKEHDTEERN